MPNPPGPTINLNHNPAVVEGAGGGAAQPPAVNVTVDDGTDGAKHATEATGLSLDAAAELFFEDAEDFSSGDPELDGGADLTLTILGGLFKAGGFLCGMIALDPPDPHYWEIVRIPAAPPFDVSRATLLRFPATVKLGQVTAAQGPILRGLLTAMERYQGAQAAHNARWTQIQGQTMLGLLDEVAGGFKAISDGLTASDAELKAGGKVRTLDTTPRISSAQKTGRLPDADVAQLRALGASDASITRVAQYYAKQEPVKLTGTRSQLVAHLVAPIDKWLAQATRQA